MRYLILLVILSSCGKLYIDPALQPYIDQFELAGNIPTGPLVAKFGVLTRVTGEEGECSTNFFSAPTITINPTFWAFASETDRTLVVFHELGHCVLNRAHNNTVAGGHPVSIMNLHATWVSDLYEINSAPFLNELFKPTDR